MRTVTNVAILILCALCSSLRPAEAITAHITITADNSYDLYINGTFVGSQNNSDGYYGWGMPETWTVDLNLGANQIAVAAQDESANSGSGIGMIAKIAVSDGELFVTDPSWKVADTVPSGWEQPGFDDLGWAAPLDEGAFDSQPWTSFAPPIAAFEGSGARWLWRGTPPFLSGYGYYNNGGYQFCYFRQTIQVGAATPTRRTTWGALKARAR